MAKSMQRPRKVNFSFKNNGHSYFSAGYPSTNCHLFIPFYHENFGLQQERNVVILFCNTSIDESILELQTFYFW
jgi:hypothetical protein